MSAGKRKQSAFRNDVVASRLASVDRSCGLSARRRPRPRPRDRLTVSLTGQNNLGTIGSLRLRKRRLIEDDDEHDGSKLRSLGLEEASYNKLALIG